MAVPSFPIRRIRHHLVDSGDQSRSMARQRKLVQVAVYCNVLCRNVVHQAVGVIIDKAPAITDTIPLETLPESQVFLAKVLLDAGAKDIFEAPVHKDGTQVPGIKHQGRREWRSAVPIVSKKNV